ncbi:unnamed protein product [Ranitomeya imitator]|uniref:Centrosomal protein POC5 n=1 Tax=Ranitomeya imitator TaxID=111125 RepID=A0ABN9KVJ8_9NEOB|nr:unnamed protein product [Ranitomeya imitator]
MPRRSCLAHLEIDFETQVEAKAGQRADAAAPKADFTKDSMTLSDALPDSGRTVLVDSLETGGSTKGEAVQLAVISNLTRALEKQKEKTELMRTFSHWRLQQIEAGQEDHVCSMADKHYNRILLKNMWRTWRSVMESNWKDKVEQACRARAEEVCIELSSDYETKVAQSKIPKEIVFGFL